MRPTYGLTDQILRSIAGAALTLWPDWYDQSELFTRWDDESWQSAFDRLEARRAVSRHRSILKPWLDRAIPLCRVGKLPLVDEFAPTVQLGQLAMALADTDVTILIRVTPEVPPDSAALLALARSLEWLSRHVPARIVVVLPAGWEGRPELDSVAWESRHVEEDLIGPGGGEQPLDEPPPTITPVRGRPHPNSPGERCGAGDARHTATEMAVGSNHAALCKESH